VIVPSGASAGLNKAADLQAGRVTNPNLEQGVATQAQRRQPRMAASGRIHFWHSGSLWIGQGRGRSEWHSHHAHQIALALDGEFRFRTERQGSWTAYEAAIVPSHCHHEFELDGSTVAHLFVEPECVDGRALTHRFGGLGLSPLPDSVARAAAGRLREALQQHADADAMKAVARAAAAALAASPGSVMTAPANDPRVARALDYIRSHLQAPVSLADAAAAATLSPSRFRHLFVQETGTSFRAYLLWLRINVAIEAAMAGASWTEAAHAAGFADSSHLTRTHRRMFGIEPTAIRPG
jgi:AraC-like DNA-binding protein/quercetin dioxygenase-like cupin family protein